MPSTTSVVILSLLAATTFAAPAPTAHATRSIPQPDDSLDVYARDIAQSNEGELEERFFFLAPLIAQGVRAGVQAGIRAGVRKGAQAAAKKGASHAAKNANNNNNNNKKHKRDLEEDDLDLYMRQLIEADSELDERFFFLAPLIAQGVRAGVQAGIRAGVKKGAEAAAKKGASHAAKNANNNNNNNNNKKHKRDLGDQDDYEIAVRSMPEDELEWDVAAREVHDLDMLD
ncbi:hypothetical protein DACRYDRAFT_110140 [Dacryopinax primogenitus]|uniref:Uncharacterized protein n=1 Tax=Dacryopinax primogenitus (strain DJM 731) TaxID=1858805 RepID=M5G0Q6_DACPD|nr:uncharacterized protein DACRYDRAFT_110140 [Dacryopinax primogenitus]EJT99416.1 hypothetical protein DACRYDRAFT_110140 [Dacryopinax primogenitus]